MQIDREFFDSICHWETRKYGTGNEVFDSIVITTAPNNIEVEACYKRNKNLVYIEEIKDSVTVFSFNVNYINMLQTLSSKIPQKKMAR